MRRLVLCTIAACIACGACQQPISQLNAPPHGATEKPSELQAQYAHMVDNALLADMTVSDVHFVPHRAMLNSLGEERLARLASLMEVCGGTVRFNTDVTDEELVSERVEKIRTFLRQAGVDTSQPILKRDLPGGAGMDAREAILIKARDLGLSKKKSGGAD